MNIFYFKAPPVQDSAANWFDNVGQVQQSIFQPFPDQAAQGVATEDNLKRDLEAKEAECMELAAKVATLDNTRQTLQDKIDELNSHSYILQEKITELESNLILKNQQEQTLAENDLKIEALEKQVDNLQTSLTESEQLLHAVESAKSDLSREIVRLEQELISQISETEVPPLKVEDSSLFKETSTESCFPQQTRYA